MLLGCSLSTISPSEWLPSLISFIFSSLSTSLLTSGLNSWSGFYLITEFALHQSLYSKTSSVDRVFRIEWDMDVFVIFPKIFALRETSAKSAVTNSAYWVVVMASTRGLNFKRRKNSVSYEFANDILVFIKFLIYHSFQGLSCSIFWSNLSAVRCFCELRDISLAILLVKIRRGYPEMKTLEVTTINPASQIKFKC